jgi:hypothetical protein
MSGIGKPGRAFEDNSFILLNAPRLKSQGRFHFVRSFNSYTAGTLVHTNEGQKPFKAIEIGDKVLAEDSATSEQGYFEVVALTNHPTKS